MDSSINLKIAQVVSVTLMAGFTIFWLYRFIKEGKDLAALSLALVIILTNGVFFVQRSHKSIKDFAGMNKDIAKVSAIVMQSKRLDNLSSKEEELVNLLVQAEYLHPSSNGFVGTITDKAIRRKSDDHTKYTKDANLGDKVKLEVPAQ